MDIHIHHHYPDRKVLKGLLMNMQELAQGLADLTAQTDKARAEVVQKIADLEAAIANAGNTTPEVDAALEALKASVQASDDVVPDA